MRKPTDWSASLFLSYGAGARAGAAAVAIAVATALAGACGGAENPPGSSTGGTAATTGSGGAAGAATTGSGGASGNAGGAGGASGSAGPGGSGGTGGPSGGSSGGGGSGQATGGSNQGSGGSNQGAGGTAGAGGANQGAGGASNATDGGAISRPDAARSEAGTAADAGPRSEAGAPGEASSGSAVREIWVSPTGNDANPGTVDAPMQTVCNTTAKVGACYKLCPSSYSCPASGATIWMKGGTYKITSKIDIGATRPGVAAGVMKLYAVAGEKPIIDASGLDRADVTKTGVAIHLKGSYWHVKGIEVMNAPHNCIKVEGGFNTIENTVVHHCANTGITISAYDGTDMSAGPGTNNTILNCDSYANIGLDGGGEDADGFGAKEQAGQGNVFRGCRAWNNADDGFDFYGWADPISVQDSWAFENAKVGAPGGDGNGFKLGNGAGGHTVTNGLAAYNIKTGYTSNGASKLSTCTNCRACSNGSVTGTGGHGISGTITNVSPCVNLATAQGPRKADGSLPTL